MFDVNKIRGEFPILERKIGKNRKLVYLDSGATAQKPKVVIDTIKHLYQNNNANIHRGVHTLSGECTEMYEVARETVCKFIGAKSVKEIVFTSGATASVNLVAMSWGAQNIKSGDEVLVSEMEHHSNIVPWQILCDRVGAKLNVLPFNDNGDLRYELLDSLLTTKTKLVAVTQTSNVLGTVNNLPLVISKAHEVGAKVIVDGCQGVVHGRVDMAELDCDFYVFSGHKLYAPTGIGVLYGKEELLESMPPFMGGGDMVATVSFAKTTYAQLPLKFEAGTSNYIGAIALGKAIDFIVEVGVDDIYKHEKELLDYATQEMNKIPGLRIYGNSENKCSIVSFNIEGVHPYDLGMILDKLGIAIRTGSHCAEPVATHYDITATARASFAMYNTKEEIDILVKGINQAVSMLK